MRQNNQIFISSVEGNRQSLDGGAMFGNAPKAVWEKWVAPDSQNRITLACRALLIEYKHHKILCETGIGAFFEPKLRDRYGVLESTHRLLESLTDLGLGEGDITAVILSHLHFDHAGGLLPPYDEMMAGRTDLLFPKARYIVGKEAWHRAKHPHFRDRASFIPGLTEKLEASGRLTIVEKDHVPGFLADRLQFRFTSGHTLGQMHTVFRGDNGTVFFAGDLIPGTAWVHLPITMGYDRFPEKLIDEKEELYQVATKNNWLVFYTHDVKTAASFVRQEKGRYEAADSLASLNRYLL